MEDNKPSSRKRSSIEMTIALVAILIMILETWIGIKGIKFFMH